MMRRLALILALVLVPVCAAGQFPLRQPILGNGVAPALTVSQAFGSSVTSGDLLIADVQQSNTTLNGTVTDSQSNTYTKLGCTPLTTFSSSNVKNCVWTATAGSTGADTVTSTFTSGSIYQDIAIADFEGGWGATIENSSLVSQAAFPITTGSVASANAGNYYLAFVAHDYGNSGNWNAVVPYNFIPLLQYNGPTNGAQLAAYGRFSNLAGSTTFKIGNNGGSNYRSAHSILLSLKPTSAFAISGTVSNFGVGTTIKFVDGSSNNWGTFPVDGSGNYSVTGFPNGTYTITPACGSFTPSTISATVSGASSTGNNFTEASALSCAYVRDAAVINATSSVSSLTATWGTPTATGDGVVVAASVPAGVTLTVSTICGSPAYRIDYAPTASILEHWYAMDVASGCTSATVASGTAESAFTVAAVDIGALPTNYIIENYNHQFGAGSPTTASVPTLGANDFLLSTTIDTSHLYTFAPSGSFSVLLNQSTTVPIMQVSTTSGGPGTYTNAVTGGSGSTYQTMLAIRSVNCTFCVEQFTDPRDCTGSGVSLTCHLPLPTQSAHLILAACLPYGTNDWCAVPTDDKSNTYTTAASVLASNNGGGPLFYARNITASSTPTVTFAALSGGSASTFTGRVLELSGMAAVHPYYGASQDVRGNYTPTTNYPFGPTNFLPGSYLIVGIGAYTTETSPVTTTNGSQLGPFSAVSQSLANTYVASLTTASAVNYTITPTPASGQPYNWSTAIFSTTPQTEGRVVQSIYCSYGCGGTGLVTISPPAAGSTMVVWGPAAGVQTISSTPAETWHLACGGTATDSHVMWYATNITGGTNYSFSFPNVGVGDYHLAVIDQATNFDGASCNEGPQSTQPYTSGTITTTHTDIIVSCGANYAAFGDEHVWQDGSWPQSFTSQFSDYDGGQCSVKYAQPPGTYNSAAYSANGAGTVSAGIIAFSDTAQPSGNYMPQIVRMYKALHAPDLIAAMKEMGQ